MQYLYPGEPYILTGVAAVIIYNNYRNLSCARHHLESLLLNFVNFSHQLCTVGAIVPTLAVDKTEAQKGLL